jgi:tetratricopeptide (TPR) repeat protein
MQGSFLYDMPYFMIELLNQQLEIIMKILKKLNTFLGSRYMSVVWIIGIALLVISPGQALPFVAVFAAIYFFYQMLPQQRAAKQIKKAERLLKFGLFEPALVSLEKALLLKTEDKYVYYLKGACLHNLGRFKEATEPLKTYKKAEPNNYDNLLIIANCYFQIEEYAKTIKILQPIPNTFPRYLRVLILLGSSYEKQKDYNKAIETYKKAPLDKKAASPDLEEIRDSLSKLSENRKQPSSS